MKPAFKILAPVALLCISLLSSGCLDILEEYFFRADGSGTAKATWNYSELAEMMGGLQESLEEDGIEEDGEGDDELTNPFPNFIRLIDEIKLQPGIRNLVNLSDEENHILSFSYEFDNLDALNDVVMLNDQLLASNMFDEEAPEGEFGPRFQIKGKKLSTMAKYMWQSEDEEDKETIQILAALYQDHYHTIRYSFEQKVKKIKGNEEAQIGPDGKSVTLKMDLSKLIAGKTELSNTIYLKK